jgi:hypothetical protein
MISCEHAGCDMTWMVPRRHFSRLAQQHIVHRDCPVAVRTLDHLPSRERRHVCCTTSEHLLTFVRLHRNATHLLPPGEKLAIAPKSGRVISSMSVLREGRGTCEAVLSHKADRDAGQRPTDGAGRYVFALQTKKGLIEKTFVTLRRTFVPNEAALGRTTNVTALAIELDTCERALRFLS